MTSRVRLLLASTVFGILVLSGCTSNDFAEQYREGSGKDFVAGNGTITEIPASERGEPVQFSGSSDDGGQLASSDYEGRPPGCTSCRR